MQRRFVRTIAALAILVVIAIAAIACQGGGQVSQGAKAAPTLGAVKASGQVVANAKVVPVQSAALSSPTGGIVAEILVREGERVQAGQVLLRFQSARQAASVAQAEADVRRAQARLNELKAGPRPQEVQASKASVDLAQAQLAKLKQGPRPEDVAAAEAALAAAQAEQQRVREGTPPEQIASARAEMDNAAAALQQAQAAYDQVAWRPDIGALPQALQLQQATNNYNAAKARYEQLVKGPTAASLAKAQAEVQRAEAELKKVKAPATAADIAAAEAEVRRAQAQFDLLNAGPRPETIAVSEAEVAAAEAALRQAKAALGDLELRAPFAGSTASIVPKVGEYAAPGMTVVWLADLSNWQIETTDLTELNIVNVREGDPVTITFDGIPGLELSGTVARIKPIGENKQGDITYTVIIKPDKQDERLRWNMTASVTIKSK